MASSPLGSKKATGELYVMPFTEKTLHNSFSNTARSEQQFATMLLPHLLMADNYAGAAALFESLGLNWNPALEGREIEVVAEVNPIRDVAKQNQDEWPGEADTDLRAAVPDLFLRNGTNALVIEAKFFTHPSVTALAEQLTAQEAAIQCAIQSTVYGTCRFHYLALTVLPLADDPIDSPKAFSRMTWCAMADLMEAVVRANPSADKEYALLAIRNAVQRSLKEVDKSPTEIGRERTIEDLIARAPALIEKGYKYVGFIGGMSALEAADLKTLEERGHYKYSDCQPNKNWIPLPKLAAKYLELKAATYDRPTA